MIQARQTWLAAGLAATLAACTGSPDAGDASYGLMDRLALQEASNRTSPRDTIAFYYGEPLNDTLYIFLAEEEESRIGNDEIQRAAIDALREKIRGLEDDQEVRADTQNPDSVLVGLRGWLSQWEAMLAGEEQVVAWMDSIRCVFRGHAAEMRRSGDSVSTINHHQTTLRQLEVADSLAGLETAVLGTEPPPLRCP